MIHAESTVSTRSRETHNIPIRHLKRKNQIHEKKSNIVLVSRWTSTWMDCNCVYTMWAVRCVFSAFSCFVFISCHYYCHRRHRRTILNFVVSFVLHTHSDIKCFVSKKPRWFSMYSVHLVDKKKKPIYQRSKQNSSPSSTLSLTKHSHLCKKK